MAEITTILIPQDPYFVPSDEAIETAKLIFQSFYDGDIAHGVFEKPAFTTSGSGFEKFSCPECGEIIDLFGLPEEYEEWWNNFMSELYDKSNDATQVKTQMPCCHKEIMATSIDFNNEAGFYSFAMEFSDWDWDELPEKQLLLFERILGCKLAQIIYVDD